MADLVDQALLIKRVPYGDTSLICHFFTEQHGRIALMARGARRPKSDFRASLEPLHLLRIHWRSGRSGMGTLTAAQRGSVLLQAECILDGQEVVAIASRLFQEGDSHGFHELLKAVLILSKGGTQSLLPAIWSLFEQAGWLGSMSHCWRCSASPVGTMFWQGGEMLCGACGQGMEISAGLRKSIEAMMRGERIMLSEQHRETWRSMIHTTLQRHGIKATESFK